MTIAIRILQKVLVNYFYTTNAGFFLFGFFVLFGLPFSPLAFHLSLISGILKSQVFLAIVMFIWLLYDLKCIDYILKQLRDPRQAFLYCFNNLPFTKIYLYMLYVQTLVYAPVLIYASAIIFIAAKNHQFLFIAEIIFFNTATVAATAFIYCIYIQKKSLFRQRIFFPHFRINLVKPFFLIPLYFLWNDRKQMLLITKLFSLLFLYGFIKLYEPERYDIRPLQLSLLLTAASHIAVVFHIRSFEEEYFTFSRNLPVKIGGRFFRIIAMYSCLLLPEFILLFKGYPVHFSLKDYPQLVLMMVALLSMFHVVLLIEDTEMDQLIRIAFGIIAACFFILLYNPGFILPWAILLLAFILLNSYYYHFEKKHK